MLTRFETAPIGELPPEPTSAHSALLAAQKPFYQVGGFGADMVPSLSSPDTRKRIADKLDVINQTLADPRLGYTQKGMDWVAEMGSSIAATIPLAYAGAEIAGGAAALAGFGGELLLPEAALTFARTPLPKLIGSDYLPSLTTAELAQGTAEAYGAYKGFTIPEHVVENYHKENDTLDMRGAIKDWASDNYGFLLPIAPLAAGYLLYKVAKVGRGAKAAGDHARSLAREHEASARARQSDLQFATSRAQQSAAKAAEEVRRSTQLEKEFDVALEKGTISKEQHAWYQEYLANPDDHEVLSGKAMHIMKEAAIPLDRVTGHAWFPVLESKDVQALKRAITDQASSGFSREEHSALSDFIVHNRVDALRQSLTENPGLVNALRGLTDIVDRKLGGRVKALKALDEVVDHHLPKGLKKNEIFSQKRIYKHLKKMGVTERSQVPYSVPDNVLYKLGLAKQHDNVMRQRSPRYRQWFQEGMHEKLKEKMKSVPLMTPVEELEHLKGKLITGKGLVKDFQKKGAYHRLRDLADVWANAKHLLDRIHLEHEYGKQAAFNNILKNFINMVDSNAARFANPERVTQYMKNRIEASVPYAREFTSTRSPLKRESAKGSKKEGSTEVKETLEGSAEMEANRELVKKSGSELGAAEYKIEENRFNQFRENESPLKKLVECAWGQLNG